MNEPTPDNVIPFRRRPSTPAAPDDSSTHRPRPPASDRSAPAHPFRLADPPYSAADAAYLLSLPVNEIYRLLRAGEIPAQRLGRTWLIPRDQLHTWVDNLPTADPADIDPRHLEHIRNRDSDTPPAPRDTHRSRTVPAVPRVPTPHLSSTNTNDQEGQPQGHPATPVPHAPAGTPRTDRTETS